MLENVDYDKLLEALLEDRTNLDRLIAWVQTKRGHAETEMPTPTLPGLKPGEIPRFPRLSSDAFFRMKVPDAIREFLRIAKRPRTAKQITAGLEAGGLTHKAQNLYATVYPTLLRMERANEVARVGKGEWGLSEWYKGRKMNQEGKPESEN